jgi:Barstar (barnase inhibitor)
MTAWRVGVIFNQVLPEYELNTLMGYMPIWAVSTPAHRNWADGLRRVAGQQWSPDPAFTLFNASSDTGNVEEDLALIDMVELHHPSLVTLVLVGINSNPRLTAGMSQRGFIPAINPNWPGITFRKPLDMIEDVPRFVLDASKWHTSDDVYDSFFAVVGAPSWHGRNFDALEDSIETGSINQCEVPYWLIIKGYGKVGDGAREMASKFINFISELEARGIPVAIRIEN